MAISQALSAVSRTALAAASRRFPAALSNPSPPVRTPFALISDVGRRRLSNLGDSPSGSAATPLGGGVSGSGGGERTAYVHPLSQIVLEHLQSSRGGWLARTGLDSGLELRPDGTFLLRFPPDATVVAPDGDGPKGGGDGIWTVYDPDKKRHYLSVRRGDLVGQYLLQDNLRPAWHTDRRSTPEKVRDAVDEMIRKLEGGGADVE